MRREQLKQRLAAAKSARASRPRGDDDLNPGMTGRKPLTPAAVLVPLVDRPGGLNVLLTERTSHLRDHAGQISFPGGRVEAADQSHEAAALRETEEEIGLAPEQVELAGRLDIYRTRTGFEITPVVGLVTAGFTLRLDTFEVEDVFEVPLQFILDPANHETHSREYEGRTRYFYALPYPGRYIWGATAGMLVNLYDVLTQ